MIRPSFRKTAFRALVLVTATGAFTAAQAQSSAYRTSVPVTAYAVENDVTFENHTTAYGGSQANFFAGTYINSLVGATTFYNAGYTGSRATLANIEGGFAAKDNITTSKTSTYFAGSGALAYGATSVQDHASWVSSMMAGYATGYGPQYQNSLTGIAYGAKLWSGNVASAFGSGGSFSAPTNAIWNSYNQALSIGVTQASTGANVGTASLTNSSWGFSSTNATSMANISAGFDTRTTAIDGLVQQTHKLAVFSAGNNATDQNGNPYSPPLNHVAGIGAGWNTLTVGSLGGNVVGNPGASYAQRSSFSSYGPNNYYNPATGTIVANVRAAVDIAAPGEEIVAEGKTFGSFSAVAGTSFAAPITAAVGGLLTDVALASNYTNATDSRVLASIMMNAADKNAGWTNNASLVDGVSVTTQGLDWQTGAGKLNADRAFTQLTAGTKDLPGLGGGVAGNLGWDLGSVSEGFTTDYALGSLAAGSTFDAMLRWDAGFTVTATATTLTSVSYAYLSNLRLELYSGTSLVAYSDSAYNNTEHIHTTIDSLGLYTMRVRWMGENYDFVNHANSETYGLAWNGTAGAVPEPTTLAALGLGALAVLRRRKRA